MGFINIHSVAKYQKTRRGDPLCALKNFRKKVAQCRKTSRDRPKSAPYQRLKNSKRTFKCQFTVLENLKTKKMDRVARRGPLARAPAALKEGHFRNCLWRKNKFSKKKSHNGEKLKGGPFGIFKHPICCKISKKLKGDPLERKIWEKSLTMPKN